MRLGLDGMTVLEVGTTVAAPYATQVLSYFGADVIKIEPPTGDPFRGSGAATESGMNGYFAMCNCGKRSVVLDLKKDEGKDIFFELVKDSDVIVENYRPGVVDRLGISYEDVKNVTEDIIYCSITGYGEAGPWSHRPGFDPILQAETGLMSVTGEKDRSPVRIGVAVIDLMTAMWSVSSIMNALLGRSTSGDGGYVEVSMFDVGISMLTKKAAHFFELGENPERRGADDGWAVPYGAYPTKDERMIMIGTPWQHLWEKLCHLIDREDLLKEGRYSTVEKRVDHRVELNRTLRETFRQKTQAEWADLLMDEIPAGPVMTVEEALTNEHSGHRELITSFEESLQILNPPARMDEGHFGYQQRPPYFGEHTVGILRDLNVSEETIQKLTANDVVFTE